MKLITTNRFNLFLHILLGLLLVISACQKESELDIPSYISIDSIGLSVTGEQGSSSNKIVDAWVYTDNDLEGAFELPAKFPVLKSGSLQLKILPGIKLNGIAETRVAYPFFNPIIIPVNLTREKETKIENVITTYNSKTVFAWLEDFEDPNISVDTSSRSDIKLSRINDPDLSTQFPDEGNSFAAKATISSDSSVFECLSHDSFIFPSYSSDLESSVFLELNYKTNCAFTIGLIVYGSQTIQKPIVVVNPSTTWNKIYINLTPTILLNSASTQYKIFLHAKKEENGPVAEIFFDNIKLLHF